LPDAAPPGAPGIARCAVHRRGATLAPPARCGDTGPVLSGAQVWTVIGGFFGMIAVLMTLMLANVASLRSTIQDKVDGLAGRMDARFEAVDARFEAVDARFEGVNRRLDNLDRDVQALTGRVFRDRG